MKRRPRNPAFRFRYLNTSGSGEVQTEWMDGSDTAIWIETNRQIVTGVDISNVRLMKPEVIAIVKMMEG